MALYFGGAPSGVGPNKFDAGIDEVKEAVNTGVQSITSGIEMILGDTGSLLTDVANLKDDTETIIERLDLLQAKFESIEYAVNESNQYINAIYYENTIVDWIKDLKTNKKNSETWRDSSKMNQLLDYQPAYMDSTLDDLLFEYVVINNLHAGQFLDKRFSTSDFETYQTIESMCADSTGFTKLVTNSNVFNFIWGLSFAKSKFMSAAYSNKTMMESVVKSNASVRNVFNSKSVRICGESSKGYKAQEKSGYFYVRYFTGTSYMQSYGNLTLSSGGTQSYQADDGEQYPVEDFATYLKVSGSEDSFTATDTGDYVHRYSYQYFYGIQFA